MSTRKQSPTRSQSDRERREHILVAARECFLQYGFAKTSLDDIAKRAGLSRPLLYRKFDNKEAIFSAVHEAMFAAMYPRLDAIVASRASRRDKLQHIAEIALFEPWSTLGTAPAREDFNLACEVVIPEVHARHERKLVEYLAKVLGDRETAEVLALAAEGLYADLPSMATLRRRMAVLVDRFA